MGLHHLMGKVTPGLFFLRALANTPGKSATLRRGGAGPCFIGKSSRKDVAVGPAHVVTTVPRKLCGDMRHDTEARFGLSSVQVCQNSERIAFSLQWLTP